MKKRASALLLLMVGVLTDYHDNTFSLDYLAFVADFLNGRPYFHVVYTIPFKSFLTLNAM